MDFELSDEQRLLQDTVRQFVDDRILPNAIENDIEHKLDMDAIAGMADLGILGVVMWAEPGQFPTPQARLQLFLVGLRYTPTKARWYVLRSDREGRYEFKRIAGGQYKLTDAIAGQPKWRLKVAVKPGENLALDLTPENSTSVRDDFPQDTKLPASQRVAPDSARR